MTHSSDQSRAFCGGSFEPGVLIYFVKLHLYWIAFATSRMAWGLGKDCEGQWWSWHCYAMCFRALKYLSTEITILIYSKSGNDYNFHKVSTWQMEKFLRTLKMLNASLLSHSGWISDLKVCIDVLFREEHSTNKH